jgi:hypothetical protein
MTLLGTSAVLAAIAACGDDDPKTGNGVNDVHQACEIRAKWNRTGNDCSLCESAVLSAHCDCESLKDFSGACLDQENARKAACPDDALNVCIFSCNASDCAFVDKCYETAPAGCKKASDARDGCISSACAPRCK